MKSTQVTFTLYLAVFLLCYFIPLDKLGLSGAIAEAAYLTQWYAREHVLLCLIPAFFIAGAISVFLSSASVMKYLGAKANKVLAYGVASVSGSVLAVCSCTVLPLFAGIYRMGAGLGPATAFLYAGPAINVLAMILTVRVLGVEIGIARIIGAVLFAIVIGLLMHLFFLKEETEKADAQMMLPEEEPSRPLWKNVLWFGAMIGVLVFANWSSPEGTTGFFAAVFGVKWILSGALLLALAIMYWQWFTRSEGGEWVEATWGFTKQIAPLLLFGVLIAGLLLGRPGHEGLLPSYWISNAVGGNSLLSNFVASFAGAFMYFATLTEIPILQGLIGAGMGKGPALALLLAGPALSLPNMLVIRSVMGTKKTTIFVSLVIIMATISGWLYGYLI